MKEFQTMSESGVYETLVVQAIRDVQVENGYFFKKIAIKCDLSSYLHNALFPVEFQVFQDPETEEFKSFTVDELPEFNADVIKSMKIQTISKWSRDREILFEQLEKDFMMDHIALLNAMSEHEINRELSVIDASSLLELSKHHLANQQVQDIAFRILRDRLN